MKYALAVATAILLILAFPKFGLAFLAPIALAPLLFAVNDEDRGWRRFFLGYTAGLVFWAGTCYWIQFVLEHHGGMGALLSWVGFAVFTLYKALLFGLFAWLAGPLMRTRWAVLAVPALWVAIERVNAPQGFTWMVLGNAGVDMALPMRLAPFTGVWGLSFVFAALATAVVVAILRRPRREFLPAAALGLMFLLPALPPPQPGIHTAVLVQPNISQTADWTPEWVAAQHHRLLSLSLGEALKDPAHAPALIVWPEVPAPIYYAADAGLRDRINKLAESTGAFVVINTVPRSSDGLPLNSALIVGPNGRPLGRYDKMNLVPFGEFVPWPFDKFVNKISTESGNFGPGAAQNTLPAGEHKIGAFVCYESVFPGFVRKFADKGAGLFVNISNDGWYGATAARDQHLAIVRMRAAENRRWILRATNDGITSTVDPAGRVWRHLPSFKPAAARTGFSWMSGQTFYSRHGDWFVWLCAAIAAAALIAPAIQRRFARS